jgi:hypothetical protein
MVSRLRSELLLLLLLLQNAHGHSDAIKARRGAAKELELRKDKNSKVRG